MTDPDASMGLLEHLEELRRRLIVIAIAVLIAAIAGFVLSDAALDILRRPLPDNYETLYFTSVGGAFAVKLKISLFLGIFLAVPVILYHVWRFVTPGLTAGERRLVWPFLGLGILLFLAGVGLGYVIIPFALNFLLGFAEPGLQPLLTIEEYVGFVTTMMLVFGLVLEFPIVLMTLARVGILNHAFLAARRRWALLLMVVFAVIATPGSDVLSPIILTSAMYLLYEATLLAIRFIRRRP
ncbi:MAG: twin-arginine translocase subunit TatC [Chloroflexota bacterium]|nr:twin-arginine translocase subunit TatC [Chloroflexota bacterium]